MPTASIFLKIQNSKQVVTFILSRKEVNTYSQLRKGIWLQSLVGGSCSRKVFTIDLYRRLDEVSRNIITCQQQTPHTDIYNYSAQTSL